MTSVYLNIYLLNAINTVAVYFAEREIGAKHFVEIIGIGSVQNIQHLI
jgi:hypothetical protein